MVRGDSRGFSLAEVVVALGVLASVLISVAGLLVVGNRLVHAGRGSSMALAVARDLVEEMHGWGYRQTFTELGCDVNEPLCIVLTPDQHLAAWAAMMEGDLQQGELRVAVSSLETGVSLGDARALRIIVTVAWKEGQRNRSLSLGTVRM